MVLRKGTILFIGEIGAVGIPWCLGFGSVKFNFEDMASNKKS